MCECLKIKNIMEKNVLNLFRLGYNSLKPSLKANPFRTCSTVTEIPLKTSSPPVITPAEETDKLYSRLELEVRGHDPAVLKSYSWFLETAAKHLGIGVEKEGAVRRYSKERYTLLKSVHVHKKHRVQYEIRTYYRFLHLHRLTGSTADTYLEYIERNLPEGVSLKATTVELQPIPSHITEPEKNDT